jgi:hypothetical protein
MSDAGNDPAIHDAISLFGSDAYYVYFRTIEIMSDHIDVKNPGKNSFSKPFLSKNFNISFKKVSEILEFFSEKEKFYLEITQNGRLMEYHLTIPKLKDLTDEYTSKVIRSESGHTPDKHPESVRKKSPINKKKKEKKNIKEEEKTFEPAHSVHLPFDSYENIEKVCQKYEVDIDAVINSLINQDSTIKDYGALTPKLKYWQKKGFGKIGDSGNGETESKPLWYPTNIRTPEELKILEEEDRKFKEEMREMDREIERKKYSSDEELPI